MKENYIPLLISVISIFLFVSRYGFDVRYIAGALSVGIISGVMITLLSIPLFGDKNIKPFKPFYPKWAIWLHIIIGTMCALYVLWVLFR